MLSLAQLCSGIAAAALLISSRAEFVAARPNVASGRRSQRLLDWGRHGGALVGVGALLLSVIFWATSAEAWLPLFGVGGRAALIALIAGLMALGAQFLGQAHPKLRGAELVPAATVAGVSAAGWSTGALETTMPLVLMWVILAAGLALWSSGRGLAALIEDEKGDLFAATITFAGLTAAAMIGGGVNWRVWGTPAGSTATAISLLAAWLVSAARLTLHGSTVTVRLGSALDLVIAVLTTVIALSARWVWPLS